DERERRARAEYLDRVRAGRFLIEVDVAAAVGGGLEHLAVGEMDLDLQVRQRFALVVLQREVDEVLLVRARPAAARAGSGAAGAGPRGAGAAAPPAAGLRRVAPLVAGDVEDAVVPGGVVEVVGLGDVVVPRVLADL